MGISGVGVMVVLGLEKECGGDGWIAKVELGLYLFREFNLKMQCRPQRVPLTKFHQLSSRTFGDIATVTIGR